MKNIFKIYQLIMVTISALFLIISYSEVSLACTPPLGGDLAISSNCTFLNGAAGVSGVDNGNLVVNSGVTLTINNGQTIVWNPGKNITIDGSIAINKGGQLKKTHLWMTDADGNGYPASLTQIAQDTQPTNARRRRDMISWSIDCYDTNANVFPGQTAFFGGHRGDGSFDYNCNGSIEKSGCLSVACTLSGSVMGHTSWGCSAAGSCSCGSQVSYPTSCSCGSQSEVGCGEMATYQDCHICGDAVCRCKTGSCTPFHDFECAGGCSCVPTIETGGSGGCSCR